MKIGYARVSSTDQDLSIQIETLEKNGCEKYSKKKYLEHLLKEEMN